MNFFNNALEHTFFDENCRGTSFEPQYVRNTEGVVNANEYILSHLYLMQDVFPVISFQILTGLAAIGCPLCN